MGSTQQALAFRRPIAKNRTRQAPRRFRLYGSDTSWAIAFLIPYVAVFLAFVAYPVVFGLWMGHAPALYGLLMSDPRYVGTVVNTLLFVAIGVNATMFGAFLLSAFFMQRGWWRRSLLVTQWGLMDSLIRAFTGEDGPLFMVSTPIAMASNIIAYIWKWLPFWTLIFVAGRMAIPQDIFEAADIDGATGYTGAIWPGDPNLDGFASLWPRRGRRERLA